MELVVYIYPMDTLHQQDKQLFTSNAKTQLTLQTHQFADYLTAFAGQAVIHDSTLPYPDKNYPDGQVQGPPITLTVAPVGQHDPLVITRVPPEHEQVGAVLGAATTNLNPKLQTQTPFDDVAKD